MTPESDSRSLPGLLSDLAQQGSALIQTELRLLRAEVSEKIAQAGAASLEVLAGALCLFAALLILLQALVVVLTRFGLSADWASLLVGIVVAVLGAVLVRNGTAQLSPATLNPTRTEAQVSEDLRAAKDQMK